jgi:hypothetical protein
MAFNSNDLINKAVNLLKAANAEYSIIGPDGKVYGEVAFQRKKKKYTNDKRYEYGERTEHVRRYVDDLKCGEVVDVPFGRYEGKAVRGSLNAYLGKLFGAGSVTTSIDHKKKVIQVLRIE